MAFASIKFRRLSEFNRYVSERLNSAMLKNDQSYLLTYLFHVLGISVYL